MKKLIFSLLFTMFFLFSNGQEDLYLYRQIQTGLTGFLYQKQNDLNLDQESFVSGALGMTFTYYADIDRLIAIDFTGQANFNQEFAYYLNGGILLYGDRTPMSRTGLRIAVTSVDKRSNLDIYLGFRFSYGDAHSFMMLIDVGTQVLNWTSKDEGKFVLNLGFRYPFTLAGKKIPYKKKDYSEIY